MLMSKSQPHENIIPAERRQLILNLLQEREFVSIAELTQSLQVSHMTIRRDLQKLEEDGLLSVVSGGAQLAKRILSEPSHLQKETLNAPEKDAIGKKAAELVPPDCCIYLDAGTTSLAMCRYIEQRSDLTIVSNDFEVINYLINKTEEDMMKVRNLGKKSLDEVIKKIRELGFDLRSKDE